MSSQTERGVFRVGRLWLAVANGARSSSRGQLLESEVTGARFAVQPRAPASARRLRNVHHMRSGNMPSSGARRPSSDRSSRSNAAA